MSNILDKLRGGDRRSIGRSDEIARLISQNPKLFRQVFEVTLHHDPIVRMRAADAIEKASRKHPELLQPYKRRILHDVARVNQQEVRWHTAQMLPRLQLTPKQGEQAVSILFEFLEDKSSIVRTFSMQALADFAVRDSRLRARVVPLLEFLTENGSPAMRSRGRKLLAVLMRQSVNSRRRPS